MVKTLEEFLVNKKNKSDLNLSNEKILGIDLLKTSDWTFKIANTKEFTHLIFNEYPARMIPQIARKLIIKYYPHINEGEKKPILDPFGGSGTSAVEALLQNINCIVFDLNPFANLLEKVKTSIINPISIKTYFIQIEKEIQNNISSIFPNYFPDMNLEYWFNKKIINELSIIRNAIEIVFPHEKIEKKPELSQIKDFFKICLAKTARNCSYQRQGEHKTYRIKKEKIPNFDRNVNAIRYFKIIFNSYSKASEKLYSYYKKRGFTAKCIPVLGNSMILEGIENNSIDLIVTSPPYGDSHTTVAYGQFSRFPLEWLGFNHREITEIDYNLLGGVKKDPELVLEKSALLFKIAKEILHEEILQQNRWIQNHLEIDKLTAENRINKESFDNLRNFENKLENINTSTSLIQFRKEYIKTLKKFRMIINDFNKKSRNSKTNEKNPLVSRLKVYDTRFPYVISFFDDFYRVFRRLYDILDRNRKCCIVIGNRTVKRVKIPTDEIIIELGTTLGFEHLNTYYREIPNKRMPKKNSPTNIKGEKITTIEKESIIILNKL